MLKWCDQAGGAWCVNHWLRGPIVQRWVRLRKLAVMLGCVPFVESSELEPDVGVSVILSEVGERRWVVAHDSRVVLLKDISLWEVSKVLKSLELLFKLTKTCYHCEELSEIPWNYEWFSDRRNLSEFVMNLMKTLDIVWDWPRLVASKTWDSSEGDNEHLVLEVIDEYLKVWVSLSGSSCDLVEGFLLRIPS